MAFQIWDDVRDLVCTEAELGKPAGHDMLEGTYTLPVIRALADPVAGHELSPLLGRPLDGPELDKARSIILSTDAIKESLAEGRRWADVAAQALDAMSLPSGPLASGAPVRATASATFWAAPVRACPGGIFAIRARAPRTGVRKQ